MFLKATGGYDRHGEQFASGLYLVGFAANALDKDAGPVLLWPSGRRKIFCCVRKVTLRQCGHWMMGTLRLGGQSLTVSGPFGSDGFPLDLDKLPQRERILPQLVVLPEDLTERYWSDDTGHNDCGAMTLPLQMWGWAHLPTLRRKLK